MTDDCDVPQPRTGFTGRLIQSVNGRWRTIVGGLLGVILAGAGAYLVLGRQVVTADVDRANRHELKESIDRNTQAITHVTERLSGVEAAQRALERGQITMEGRILDEQRESRRRLDALLEHLHVRQPE